jgi:hypothetical protein
MMWRFISRFVLRYHRWVGLLAALPVIFWGLSGLSHPVMSRLQPQPAAMTPPMELISGFSHETLAEVRSLAELADALPVERVSHARLLRWQGQPMWQLTQPGKAERLYVDAVSGQRRPDLDRELAVWVARHYTGEAERAVTSVQLVTSFSDDYPYVNRLLPVWRVEFAGGDHLRAFVETSPVRLATLDNDAKSLFGRVFRALHSWSFIASESLRDSAMTFFLLLAMASSLGGLWLYGFYWRKPVQGERLQPIRRWHRRMGLAVVLSTLAFTGSALLHVLMIDKTHDHEAPTGYRVLMPLANMVTRPQMLAPSADEQIEVVPYQGEPVYRMSMGVKAGHGGKAVMTKTSGHEHHHGKADAEPQSAGERYVLARDGKALVGGAEAYISLLAAGWTGLPDGQVRGVEKISRFAGEYGFVNKRLPVWKVNFDTPDHLVVYVEPSSGVQAAEVRDSDRLEGFTFAYLHKWHFLDGLGKDVRDALAGLFALLNVLVVGLGLLVWWRRIKARLTS